MKRSQIISKKLKEARKIFEVGNSAEPPEPPEDTEYNDGDAYRPRNSNIQPQATSHAPSGLDQKQQGQPTRSNKKVDVTPVTKINATVDNSRKIELLNTILDDMLSGTKKKLLIPGDTGIGKTSFVKQFAEMMGMPMVLVEVPHTVEEHLINIPFITISPTGQTSHGTEEVGQSSSDEKKYDIELARSNLVTTLEQHSKIPDAQYAAHVASLPPNTQQLLKEFNSKWPKEIAKARAQYTRILFLDEYFRQTTAAIRNSLRNLLDYRIGNDPIPRGTYIMYASNVADKGLDLEQSSHATFDMPEFDAPSAIAWLDNMISGKAGKTIKFKKDVVDAFLKSLKDEHLSAERLEGQVRISPRRWSEIFLQINAAYPFEDEKEASILHTTLKRQFENEDKATHGEVTKAYDVLNDILVDLYNKSDIDKTKIRPVKAGEWRSVVAHHVLQKEKMGENKKYIPVVQGPPGIGKTSLGETFEEPPYNMRFIVINSTDLDPDSVIGIPTSDMVNGKRVTTFSKPSLYMKIEELMGNATEAYKRNLQLQEREGELDGKTATEVFNEWKNKQYRFVVFFDEINRVKNLTVFNSLRRLILEKEFNHEYKLGKDVVVLGAMNPGDKGTIGMTDHFKDAIDLIDAEPDWEDTLQYIKARAEQYKEKYSNTAVETALQILEAFPKEFTQKSKDRKPHQFYVKVGQVDEIYINPRDYDELFKSLCYSINREIEGITDRMDRGEDVSEDEINRIIINAALKKFRQTLSYLVFKNGFQVTSEFWDKLESVLQKSVSVSLKKATTKSGLSSILDHALKSSSPLKDDGAFFEYMEDYMPEPFQKDFYEYLDNKFLDFSDGTHNIDMGKAIPFLFEHGKGSIYHIVDEIKEAVVFYDAETGIFDEVEDVVHNVMDRAAKTISETLKKEPLLLEKTATLLVKSYKEIMNLIGK